MLSVDDGCLAGIVCLILVSSRSTTFNMHEWSRLINFSTSVSFVLTAVSVFSVPVTDPVSPSKPQMSRCGGCQVCHQLWLPQLIGGLHPPHRSYGPQHQQRHSLHLLYSREHPPSPRADPGSGGGPTGHQSQTTAAGWYWTWRRRRRWGTFPAGLDYYLLCMVAK